MYHLKFWFEHGGGCLWSANDQAHDTFGYKVSVDALSIGDTLKDTLKALENRYKSYLNWDDPAALSPWTGEEKQAFLQDADAAYQMLCEELGGEFTVENKLHSCVSL